MNTKTEVNTKKLKDKRQQKKSKGLLALILMEKILICLLKLIKYTITLNNHVKVSNRQDFNKTIRLLVKSFNKIKMLSKNIVTIIKPCKIIVYVVENIQIILVQKIIMINKVIRQVSRCANCVAGKSRILKQKSNKKIVGTK